jgi:hypothetical protein
MTPQTVAQIRAIDYPEIKAYLQSLGATARNFPTHAGAGDYWQLTLNTQDAPQTCTFALPFYNATSDADHLDYAHEAVCQGLMKLAAIQDVSVTTLIENIRGQLPLTYAQDCLEQHQEHLSHQRFKRLLQYNHG